MVPVTVLKQAGRFQKLRAIRKHLREWRPDIVVAYKTIPSTYAEIAGLPGRNWRLIVSERNHSHRGPTLGFKTRMLVHHLSDAVVCNSNVQCELIRNHVSSLSAKTFHVANCLDLGHFRPATEHERPVAASEPIRLLVLGRVDWQKNPLRLCEAVYSVREQHGIDVVVDWYGNSFLNNGKPGPQSGCYLKTMQCIQERAAQAWFRLHEPVRDVRELLWRSDALMLASLYEGFSNVIGEAMACGKPVLASVAGDNVRLVEEGSNGFLFDPLRVDDIARAIVRFARLAIHARAAFGMEGRRRAEALLSPERFLKEYEAIFAYVRRGQ